MVAKDYNKHMGGVDKHDMLRQIYGINRKSLKWWHRIFFRLLDMTIVNSFLIHKEHCQSAISLLDYRGEIACGLLAYTEHSCTHHAKRKKEKFSTPDSVRLSIAGIHWPLFTNIRGRCEVCSLDKVESRPLSKCSHCGVHLCCNVKKNCFVEYHK
jgi:hypothetical protein